MEKRKNQKGFTLVELVIVIAVIAILAAVLIPTFITVIGDANESAAVQEATNLRTGIIEVSGSDFDSYCKDYLEDSKTTTPGYITISVDDLVNKNGDAGKGTIICNDTATNAPKFSDFLSNVDKLKPVTVDKISEGAQTGIVIQYDTTNKTGAIWYKNNNDFTVKITAKTVEINPEVSGD